MERTRTYGVVRLVVGLDITLVVAALLVNVLAPGLGGAFAVGQEVAFRNWQLVVLLVFAAPVLFNAASIASITRLSWVPSRDSILRGRSKSAAFAVFFVGLTAMVIGRTGASRLLGFELFWVVFWWMLLTWLIWPLLEAEQEAKLEA